MKTILILGGHGNGLFIANMINQAFQKGQTDMYCKGFVNDDLERVNEYSVEGTFSQIETFIKKGYYFVNAISIDNRPGRIDFFRNLKIPANKFVTFIHPTAFISRDVSLGFGVIVGPHVTINSSTTIGQGVRIMPGSSIGTRCNIQDFAFISVNSCIDDFCEIGAGTHIGIGALITKGTKIGDSALIGMGAFVQDSVPINEIWVGYPAHFIKKRF